MLTLPPAVPSDDGKHDAYASVETEVKLQSLLYTGSGCQYQGAKHECKSELALVTQVLGLSVTCWDQRGGRKALMDRALVPSLSVFQANNTKSATSSCQHGRTSFPKNA